MKYNYAHLIFLVKCAALIYFLQNKVDNSSGSRKNPSSS